MPPNQLMVYSIKSDLDTGMGDAYTQSLLICQVFYGWLGSSVGRAKDS